MKAIRLVFLCVFISARMFLNAADAKPNTAQLIHWLLQEKDGFREIPFPEVVQAASGKKVLPLDLTKADDRTLIAKIGLAADEVIRRMNAPDSPAQKTKRINEASSHFEDELRKALGTMSEFSCDFPKTAAGKTQRSGYPDLRLVEKKSGRVIYLDPKLYEQGSRASTFRTFYFEPKGDTGKIHDDAHHLLIGFEHSGKEKGGFTFLHWELVDLSKFRVRLKAEFQGSNRDLYQPAAIVGSSRQ